MALVVALSGVSVAPLTSPGNQAAQAAAFSVSTHERLSRYGEWRTSSRFGEVWVPTVQTGWRPYTVGHWVWTDDGWYWQSDEPFGWVVFHYGRWAFDQDIGWVWIAGDDWAPAWVVWRESDEDIGWVPAPPPEVVVEDDWWSFAPVAAIGAVAILPLLRPVSDNVTYVRNTTIINQNITVNNYRRAGTVRIGSDVVPVNAGPPLSRLPSTVVKSVRAAKVVPPRSGSVATAHLDPSKGAVIKTSAVKAGPAPQILQQPGANGTASAVAGKGAPAAAAAPNRKKPVGTIASTQSGKTPPAVPGLVTPRAVNAATAMQHKPVVGNKRITSANTPSRQLLLRQRAASLQQHKQVSATPRAMPGAVSSSAMRQAMKRQQALAMHTRPTVHAQARAMPRHPAPAMQARRPVKCDPHDPHCRRPG